jgi:hypothetical protein
MNIARSSQLLPLPTDTEETHEALIAGGDVQVAFRGHEIVSVASHGVCFMRIRGVPTRQPHAYALHRKMWVYRMFNNLKVLTQLHYRLLYTQLYAHIQNCLMISTMHSCYIMLLSNV